MEEVLKQILGELRTLNSRVGNLENGQAELKADVSEIKKKQTAMEEGQEVLGERLTKLEEGQEVLGKRLTKLEEGQKVLGDRLTKLEEGQEVLGDRLIKLEARLENEVIEKVRALFDARETQSSINDRIIAALERIEAKVDVLQMETAHLRRIK